MTYNRMACELLDISTAFMLAFFAVYFLNGDLLMDLFWLSIITCLALTLVDMVFNIYCLGRWLRKKWRAV